MVDNKGHFYFRFKAKVLFRPSAEFNAFESEIRSAQYPKC